MNKRRDRNDENNSDISWFQMMGSQLAWQWKKERSLWPQFLWISSKMWKVKEERCPVIFKGYLLKWWCWWIFRTSSKSFDNCWKAKKKCKVGKLLLVSWNGAHIASREWSHHTPCKETMSEKKSPWKKFNEKSLHTALHFIPCQRKEGGHMRNCFCSREEASLHVAIYYLVSHLFKVPHACI